MRSSSKKMAADESEVQVEGVFLASFHVRTGNTLSFVHPAELQDDLSAAHAEWKALPSGSHAVERDTIFFSLSPRRTAVACFRNVALLRDEDDPAQRGARMLSVGAVFSSNSPTSSYNNTHLPSLDTLADSIAATSLDDEEQVQHLIKTWYQSAESSVERNQQRDSFAYSALSHFPALSASLGPLLPPLLKFLATGHTRLLIYSTAPLQPAASLAHNLADIVHSAQRRAGQNQSHAPPLHVRGLVTLHDIVALDEESRQRTVDTPGWIAFTSDKILLDKCALFDLMLDLTPLQGGNGNSKAAASPRNRPSSAAGPTSSSGAKPRFSIVVRPTATATQQPPKLKESSWTTHEYAEMRLVEDKAKRRIDSPSSFNLGAEEGPTSPIPAASDATFGAARQVTAVRQRKPSNQPEMEPSQQRQQQPLRTRPSSSLQPRTRGVFLNLVSLLRYVFAQTLWFFPSAFWTPASASTSALTLLGASSSSTRRKSSRAISGLGLGSSADGASSIGDSAFILPLGVRPDGGLRASVLLDDDDDDDEDEDEEDEEEPANGQGDDEGEGPDSDTETAGRSTQNPPSTPRGARSQPPLIDVSEQTGARPVIRHAGVIAAAEVDDLPGSPDPFLAACGAGSGVPLPSRIEGGGADSGVATNLRVRNSRSSMMSSHSTAKRLRKSVVIGGPSSALLDDSALMSDDEDEEEELARALAGNLREAWTDWLAVLYVEISALVGSSSTTTTSSAPVELDGHDLASIGLSTRNGADCALVRAVGRRAGGLDDGMGGGGREVFIRTGWSWSAVFR
ncbi:hypothetical protein A4X13_0g394 [Tilletia indica]|uniref:Uncharacterized protein n=1 Tax=Tilletia indica TaxID=43049 RepID=A0A177TSB2_9BASI|nr:hypothetical protein A4X13_0g394 [Tilletia indica]